MVEEVHAGDYTREEMAAFDEQDCYLPITPIKSNIDYICPMETQRLSGMDKSKSSITSTITQQMDKLLVLLCTLGALLPTSPFIMPFTNRDSGVFLYIGWRILNGEVPYRDIWDHKPPVIYFIDAAGLAISNNSRWGVWVLELVSLFIAAYIGFRLIKKAMGTSSAIFSLFLWLLTLVLVIEGGNLTTEYTLPLQFAALWLAYDLDRSDYPASRLFLIGILGGIAFFTKQTAVGVWIAIVVYISLLALKTHQVRLWFREILYIGLGGLAISICWIIYFSYQHGLPQFWSAAFEYNFVYSAVSDNIVSRLSPFLTGQLPLGRAGLLQFGLVGYLIGMILLRLNKGIVQKWLPLLSIGLINLPIEFLLISISGRNYGHYYMTTLPVLSLFAAFAFWTILTSLKSWSIPNAARNVFVGAVIGAFLWSAWSMYQSQVITNRKAGEEDKIRYLQKISKPEDPVLLWGSASYVHFFAQRKSPTKFVYQYPLYTKGYVDEQMIMEFFADIERNCPRFIIDTHDPRTPLFDFSIKTDRIAGEILYLKSTFTLAGKVGTWTVYENLTGTCNP